VGQGGGAGMTGGQPPLALPEGDAEARDALAQRLAGAPEAELAGLLAATRRAAAAARAGGDMPALIDRVRAMKLLHRIAGERGLLLPVRGLADVPAAPGTSATDAPDDRPARGPVPADAP